MEESSYSILGFTTLAIWYIWLINYTSYNIKNNLDGMN